MRKWLDCSYIEKVWQQRYTRYASMTYLGAVSSYSALSFRSSGSGSCNECWVRKTFETCFSEQERHRNWVYPEGPKGHHRVGLKLKRRQRRRFSSFSCPRSSEPLIRRQSGSITIVDLRGTIDLGEASLTLRRTISDLLKSGRTKSILNFREVNSMGSAGLGKLVGAHMPAKSEGGELKQRGQSASPPSS
jgi:anti-anti-sigma factor